MKPSQQPKTAHRNRPHLGLLLMLILAALTGGFSGGCAVTPKTLAIKDRPIRLTADTILETATAAMISREQLYGQLNDVQVVYVGESHTNPAHHAIQLSVIKALAQSEPNLTIGMEMFDRTYQPVLDRWSAGELDEETFLRLTHWYANWRYDFGLYRDILDYAKEKRLRIIALNIPFCLPGKIAVGGLASLSEADRRLLPRHIDTSNSAHRAYLENIYKMHATMSTIRGRDNFEFFYEAQCAWEDGMAEMVAANVGVGKMVVLAGNGHIIKKFGIPDRAFARVAAPFKTIYLASVGDEAELDWADYLWATADTPKPRMHR